MLSRFLLSKWIQVSLSEMKGQYHHSATQVQHPCRDRSSTCRVTCKEWQGLFFIRSWKMEEEQLHHSARTMGYLPSCLPSYLSPGLGSPHYPEHYAKIKSTLSKVRTCKVLQLNLSHKHRAETC